MKADKDNFPSAESESKYQRIVRELTEDITNGRLSPYEQIPSERALMRRFGVARQTVRQALRLLQTRGLVRSRQGRGTYVAGKAFLQRKVALLTSADRTNPRFARIAAELAVIAERWSLELVTATSVDEFTKETLAGVLFEPGREAAANEAILTRLRANQVPVVLLGADVPGEAEHGACDVIVLDELAAGALIARHLQERNAKNPRFLLRGCDVSLRGCDVASQHPPTEVLGAPPRPAPQNQTTQTTQQSNNSLPPLQRRLIGFAAALDAPPSSLAVTVDPADPIALSGLLFAEPDIDAFVCADDTTATTLIASLRQLGLRVPEDVRVVGCEDGSRPEGDRTLTALRPPFSALARLAFDRLKTIAADPRLPAIDLMIKATLEPGEST